MTVQGDLCHDLLKTKKGCLSFDENKDYGVWKEQVKEKLLSLAYIQNELANWNK